MLRCIHLWSKALIFQQRLRPQSSQFITQLLDISVCLTSPKRLGSVDLATSSFPPVAIAQLLNCIIRTNSGVIISAALPPPRSFSVFHASFGQALRMVGHVPLVGCRPFRNCWKKFHKTKELWNFKLAVCLEACKRSLGILSKRAISIAGCCRLGFANQSLTGPIVIRKACFHKSQLKILCT